MFLCDQLRRRKGGRRIEGVTGTCGPGGVGRVGGLGRIRNWEGQQGVWEGV